MDANGLSGLAEWDEEQEVYNVHTYSGFCLRVQEARLREVEPQGPEEGGFDCAWPRTSGKRESFTRAVVDALLRKGYCLVQMPESEAALDALAEAASSRSGFGSFRQEFEGAYLGHDVFGSWKTLWLEREDEEVFATISPVMDLLGATTLGRLRPTRGLLRAAAEEEEQLARQPVSEADVRAGLVEAHLDFVQRQRLCLLRPLAGDGGTVELYPRNGEAEEGEEDAKFMSVFAPRGKLLVFCQDLLDYRYEPAGADDLLLQAWLLEEPQRLLLDSLEGGVQGMEAIFGGPPQESGLQVHVMSATCRLPGNARHLDRDWLVFAAGTDLHVQVPFARFDIGHYFDPAGGQFAQAGRTIIQHSAFLREEEVTCFDNGFFGIEESVAAQMPPSQRMNLETSFEGLAMAGFTRKSLRGQRMMLVVGEGVSGLDWDWKPALEKDPNAFLKANAHMGLSTTNRLAYVFGTTGPAFQVDCACSSELVAASYIHAALRAHTKEGVRMGLAMAGQVMVTPWPFVGGSMAGLHGDLGRCATFNASANGFVRGEGSCGLFLSAREDPEAVQERLACYLASYINQDGRSATLTAPNGMSQAKCIMASMREANIDPTDVCFSETHGTATAIGDPIEVGSLVRVFQKHKQSLGVTAGKSNVGHTEPVAGGYSLLRTIVTLVKSCIPPNVHFRVLSKNISSFSFVGNTFPGYFPSEAVDQLLTDYAIGGVTSFGYGGTNCRSEIWAPGRRVRDPIEIANRGSRGLRIDRFGSSSSKFPRELRGLDCVTVACPSCLGPMCWLCAMAVPSSSSTGGRHYCHAIREEGASYEYCSDCYAGSYSFGTVVGEPLEPEQRLFLRGSWSGWTAMEEMEEISPGTYTGMLVLGETRMEQFHLVLEEDKALAIYPVTSKADQTARILGPHENLEGQNWLIDGFRERTPAGTVYQVRFEWGTVRKSISWKAIEVGEYMRAMLESSGFEHSYFLARRGNGWKPEKMHRAEDDPDFWEWTGALSSNEEEIHFLRDKDPTQMIYPQQPRSIGPDCPVMGPDEDGDGRGWLVISDEGENMTARLRVRDGGITVTTAAGGSRRTWQSSRRPPGERYFVVGSWSGWRQEHMAPDADAPEVHRLQFRVGASGRGEFQIVASDRYAMRMYPATAHARPGQEMLCCGENPDGFAWEVVGPSGQMMEIRLDLGAEDTRKAVTSGLVL